VVQRLQDDPPGQRFDLAVVAGAVQRPGRAPGTLSVYRWDNVLPSADGIQVPYDKATVKDAPNLDLDDDLPADQVTALYRHYSLNVDNAPNGDTEHTVGR